MSKVLDAALSYARAGWSVFPCRPGAKTPLTPRGLHDSTTDEATIITWWRTWPEANVAVNCGASGLAVVDLDVKGGIDGIANWEAWCSAAGVQPNGTMTQHSPSGGMHLIYLGQIRNSASIIAPGVDSRGAGGYILLAPSVVGGKPYRLAMVEDPVILPVPEALLAALRPRERVKQALKPSTPGAGTLVDMIAADGHVLARKGGLDEWCGACPWCGGHDRFIVGWQGEGRDGGQRYYCRQCERKGDAASWLIDRKGIPVVEAKQALGLPVDPKYLGYQPDTSPIEWPEPVPVSVSTSSEPVPEPVDPWDRYMVHASEMIEHQPPATVWDVEGLLEAASLTVVYGKPGSLKSMLWADLALAVASGRTWLPPGPDGGAPPLCVRPGSVGWIDMDNGRRRTHHRVHALAHGAGVENPDLYFWSFPPCDLAKAETLRVLERIILKYHLKMLVIDTLINSMNIKNENDNSELRGPLLGLRTLVEVTGCGVSGIHHPKKGQAVGRMSDDLRGGGAIAGALDIAIRIEREEKGNRIQAVATKVRGADISDLFAAFTFTKDLTGEMVQASWHSVEKFGTHDGLGIEVLHDSGLKAQILQALDGCTLGVNEIFNIVGGGKQKFIETMKVLQDDGLVEWTKAGQKRLYRAVS